MGEEIRRLDSLTGLRFIAALFVVLHHATRHYAPVPFLTEFFDQGAVGVTFFFILSGFVLAWSRNPAQTKRSFYRNRFARVYPLHLATFLLAIPLVITSGTFNWGGAIAALSLVQAWSPDRIIQFAMNSPSWSLSCEAFFYALFPFLIGPVSRMNRRRLLVGGVSLLALFTAVFLVLLFIFRGGVGDLLNTNPLFRIGEFLLGIALATALKGGFRIAITTRAAIAIALGSYATVALANYAIEFYAATGGSGIGGLPSTVGNALVLPGFALLIVAFAQSDLSSATSFVKSPRLVKLGQWSFALYLSHLLIISALDRLLPNDLPLPLRVVQLALTVVACVAASGILYEFVEKPLESKLRSPRPRTPLYGGSSDEAAVSGRI